MQVFELTRRLIDIESITPNELAIGNCLAEILQDLASRFEGAFERMQVEPGRDNLLVRFGEARIVLSTHMDTVPPFIPSHEDDNDIWGRGACDTKGIIASMIIAAEGLLRDGARNFGLLFVVGEERNSAGALAAAHLSYGTRFLINGEPTENKLAIGSKGALRYEIVAHGKMAHSAYPELGESAIDKLLDALERIRRIRLPVDPVFGPCTMNIGVISGGRAPNVIPDRAQAEVLIRVVGDVTELREQIAMAAGQDAEAHEVLFIPAIHLTAVTGFETTVVAYTTDIPAFGEHWGQALLIGPGTIHVAHTAEERVPKAQLLEAVELYSQLVRRLSV